MVLLRVCAVVSAALRWGVGELTGLGKDRGPVYNNRASPTQGGGFGCAPGP